jgi:hypothetical protein
LQILHDQLDEYRHGLADLKLRDMTDEDVLSVSVEVLAAAVLAMLASGAELKAEVDEDGFGHAWVETTISFEDALAVSRWTQNVAGVRCGDRQLTASRTRRGRRVRTSRTSRTARGKPRKRGGSDDPHPPPLVSPRGSRRALSRAPVRAGGSEFA